jgi:predicted peroxiredoxin
LLSCELLVNLFFLLKGVTIVQKGPHSKLKDMGADIVSELFGDPEDNPGTCLWLANCMVNGLTRIKHIFV